MGWQNPTIHTIEGINSYRQVGFATFIAGAYFPAATIIQFNDVSFHFTIQGKSVIIGGAASAAFTDRSWRFVRNQRLIVTSRIKVLFDRSNE